MKVPKNDSLANRTLFNNDPARTFIGKKQTDLNQKEQLETGKEDDSRQSVNSKDRAHSENLQDAGSVQTNPLRMFFYFKEFLAGWLAEFSIRPTQINIIVSVTLYLIALSSTMQRRDGDRWLKSLLNAKLPGYSTLYQESSWETFRSYTCKRLLAFQSHEQHRSRHSLLDNRNSSDTPAGKSLKRIGGQLQDTPPKHFQFTNSPLGRGNAIGFKNRQFVDLYKDKALIYLHSPWDKYIRKDFVGFFVKRQLRATDSRKNQPGIPTGANCAASFVRREDALDTNYIVLPWYRIDAYNRPNRVVLAAPKQEESKTTALSTPDPVEGGSVLGIGIRTPKSCSQELDVHCNKQDCDTIDLSKGQDLRYRRERSLLALREKQGRFKLGDCSTPSQANSYPVKDKILGLEYLFPFQTSKGRACVQDDSIPLKLESAYSLRDLFSSSPGVFLPEKASKASSLLEAALLDSTRNRFLEQKDQLFVRNQQVFFGKNVYSFQKRLRELFYWYGLLPPSNLMGLVGKKLPQPQADKQTSKDELNLQTKLENFEDNALSSDSQQPVIPDSNLDQVLEESAQSYQPNSLQEKRQTLKSAGQDESMLPEIATANLLQRDQKEGEDKLATLVCKELAQLPNDTGFLRPDSKKEANPEMLDLFADTPEWEHLENKKALNGLAESPTGIGKPFKASSAKSPSLASMTRSINRFNLGVKQRIERLIDESAEQASTLTDLDESTLSKRRVERKISPDSLSALDSSSLAVTPGMRGLGIVNSSAYAGLESENLQEAVAQFPFRNWPLQANINSFAQQDGALSNRFEKNCALSTRLMSGYRFPDCTKQKTDRLFREFVLPHLFFSGSVGFSHSYLTNQTLLRPLYIKLPPAMPFSFFERLALSLCGGNAGPKVIPFAVPERQAEINSEVDSLSSMPQNSDIKIEYKRISLQELNQVKETFTKLGRDYQDYVNLPKDSPPAIRISPSLEDDNSIKLDAANKEKVDEERVVTLEERLQALRERQERFEQGKELRPFAYTNQYAFVPDDGLPDGQPDGQPAPEGQSSTPQNNALGKSILPRTGSDSSPLVSQNVKAPAFTEEENSWIRSRFGSQNLLSDRKYSFFGRKHMLTQRLVAQEQKEIAEQITKNSYCAPGRKFFDEKQHTSDKNRFISHRRLQRRARKGLIKLLGSPSLSAHNIQGSLNRTRRANRSLRGKVLKSAYSHLRWQKKRFVSRMLGTPCKRHLVMPEIASNDWKKMLEWQLKNYFFLEEKRLEPLVRENPEKSFKVRQLHIYLPWVTIRTPSNKPFQWPYTRLDYADFNEIRRGMLSAQQAKDLVPDRSAFGTLQATRGVEASYKLPDYKPVYYWDSGKSVSLSVPASARKAWAGNSDYRRAKGSTRRSNAVTSDGIRRRAREESYLCEPLTNQSWLLVYRLFLAFAVQNLVKYVYRVSLKGFLLEMANSDFGLTATSPQFREWLQGTQPKSFYTPKKRLRDVAAIGTSIPVISEIVWYLRNSGRGRAASRGFLLVGPAGSEKSSVVQAIAGECRVPVVVQSMNALALTDQDPYERLQDAFKTARQKAPCVLFLDDLDIVGQSRANVTKNDVGAGDSLFALDAYTAEGKLRFANLSSSLQTQLLPTAGNRNRHSSWRFNPLAANPVHQPGMESEIEHKISAQGQRGRAFGTLQQSQNSQTRRLNLLLCLLTEMDGIAPLNGVIILATSEQPALLDPALLRAGRFERKIHISLPNKERRVQLLKAGTKKIGQMQSLPWDYLGMRTKDMSAATIASAINHSAIRAIIDNTVHTVESLEHGFNCVSGLPNRSLSVPVFKRNDPFHYSRLAFYQAGKAVVHNLLLDHPQLGFCTLNSVARDQTGTGRITRESTQVLVSNQASSTALSALSRPEFNFATQASALKGADYAEDVPPRAEDVVEEPAPEKQSDQELSTRKIGPFSSALSKEVKRRERYMRSQFRKNASSPEMVWDTQAQKTGTPASARTRVQFETRLVGLYAGKAAELLHLSSSVVSRSAADRVDTGSPLAASVKRLIDSRAVMRIQPDPVSGHLKSSTTSGWLWQSDLGLSDLLTASSLTHLMIDRWYLYSQKLFTYKINRLIPSRNHEQMRNETRLPLAKRLSKEYRLNSIKPNFWGLTSYTSQTAASGRDNAADDFSANKQIHQDRDKANWWQAKVCQALEMRERPYGKWYRIYLPTIEEREHNKEWIPPDTIFHQSLALSNIAKNSSKEGIDAVTPSPQSALEGYPSSPKQRRTGSHVTDQSAWKANLSRMSSSGSVRSLRLIRLHLNKQSSPEERVPSLKSLNDLYLFERDSAHQKAVMSCFYKAFNLLNDNRELLDYFADHLIRFKILRSHEISKICSLFLPPAEQI